jgi:hypothetical protein
MASVRNVLRNYIFNDSKDETLFYGKYQGGRKLSFLKKIILPLLDLRSLGDYFKYHNNKFILNTFGQAVRKDHNSLSANEQVSLKKLRSDGIVFLDGYFKDQVDRLVSDNIKDNDCTKNRYYFYNDIVQSEDLYQILNDESLIKIASEYYGVKSFYRYRPNVNLTNPARDDLDSRKKMTQLEKDEDFADEWHVDSVYNLQYHILLRDVSPGESRMLFAKGREVGFFDRFCGYASEEYVRKNFAVVDCWGSKGTVILFDGSTHWHRLFPVRDKKRFTSSVLFTRGQQINLSNMYSEPLITKNLSDRATTSCKFIM